MKNKILEQIDNIVERIYYFQNQKNKSLKTLSLKIKMDENIKDLKNNFGNLPLKGFLKILKSLNISLEKFFSTDYQHYDKNIELLNLICNLNDEMKNAVISVIHNMK